MRTPRIVEVDPCPDALPRLSSRLVSVQVNVFVLQRRKSDLRLEFRRAPDPVPFANFLLLPPVESSPYPAVRKNGTTSLYTTGPVTFPANMNLQQPHRQE